MYLPEADFEYLIRTLSDAHSRAAELAVSIGSRLGAEHRLAQLANAASSNIENTLRQVRNAATEKQESAPGLADLRDAVQTRMPPVAPVPELYTPALVTPSFASEAGLDPEHWLTAFVDDLVAQARVSGAITFENAERLLQQRKDEFLRDFLTARRMYRAYPRLFPEVHAIGQPH